MPDGDEPNKKQERMPDTPEGRVEYMQKLGDQGLTELLQNWMNIRTAQDTGAGVRDDVIQLDLLFNRINGRLGELGQKKLAKQEDLP